MIFTDEVVQECPYLDFQFDQDYEFLIALFDFYYFHYSEISQ